MVRRESEEDLYTLICEQSTRYGLSRETVETIIHEPLHSKNICAMWLPRLLTDEQNKQSGMLKETASNFWAWWNQTTARHCDWDEISISSSGIPNKQLNQMLVDKYDTRPVVYSPGFQSRKQLVLFSAHVVLLQSKFCLRKLY